MNSLSSNVPPVENSPARKPFSQLAAFTQQLRSSGPPLARDVHAASTNMPTSLSHTLSQRGLDPSKFNFGVGKERGGHQAGGHTGWGGIVFGVLYGK